MAKPLDLLRGTLDIIRMAIGARSSQVLSMVLRETLLLAFIRVDPMHALRH